MVILQSCLDVLRGEQESFADTCSPSSDDGKQFVFVNVDDTIIKWQEDPEATTSTATNNDPLVSCMFFVYQVLPTLYRD
jgi:hypothetical protein